MSDSTDPGDPRTNHSRPRYQVHSISPLNFAQEANKLSQLIKQYDINDNSDSLFVQ